MPNLIDVFPEELLKLDQHNYAGYSIRQLNDLNLLSSIPRTDLENATIELTTDLIEKFRDLQTVSLHHSSINLVLHREQYNGFSILQLNDFHFVIKLSDEDLIIAVYELTADLIDQIEGDDHKNERKEVDLEFLKKVLKQR